VAIIRWLSSWVVSPEFLQCQIEIGTSVCKDIGEARADLKRLRSTVSDCAAGIRPGADRGLLPPLCRLEEPAPHRQGPLQPAGPRPGGVVRRMLICGMHMHVGLPDPDLRVDLMGQLSYFLPHLLALSSSSPFWQGEDTGLASYRLTVFDNLPRTGLPPRFNSWAEYERTTGALIELGLIEDTTKIWWDLRPSHRFPTLETRICDVCPRLEDALCLAAVVQCLTRYLTRLRRQNVRWRIYDRFLINENRWRAQRYGVGEKSDRFRQSSSRIARPVTAQRTKLARPDNLEIRIQIPDRRFLCACKWCFKIHGT
jgi:carboxylate-amine ligase